MKDNKEQSPGRYQVNNNSDLLSNAAHHFPQYLQETRRDSKAVPGVEPSAVFLTRLKTGSCPVSLGTFQICPSTGLATVANPGHLELLTYHHKSRLCWVET